MFFSISSASKNNFSNFYQLGKNYVSTDVGWQKKQINGYTVVYKGYADIGALDNLLPLIVQQSEPKYLGNFCAIVYDSDSDNIKIKTDRYRSFPIFVDPQHEITNLVKYDYTVWTDGLITIDSELNTSETKFDVIGEINTTPLSLSAVVDKVNKILNLKTQQFVAHNKQPVRVFLSGGVDSLLVYSYLQKYTDNYQFVKCEHIDYDRFWLLNMHLLKEFWGYQQIHHWNEPCVLTSGAPGDEFMLRSPTTVDLFLKFNGYNILDLLAQPQWNNCLHYSYYQLPKHTKIFQTQTVDSNIDSTKLFWNLCNTVVNDWQHWHVGNTLTWTPLRDLEIFKLFLRLPVDQSLPQIMDSAVSKQLIDQNKPGLTRLISDQKNTDNYMKNLCDFLL
jgi:hypothetical protein